MHHWTSRTRPLTPMNSCSINSLEQLTSMINSRTQEGWNLLNFDRRFAVTGSEQTQRKLSKWRLYVIVVLVPLYFRVKPSGRQEVGNLIVHSEEGTMKIQKITLIIPIMQWICIFALVVAASNKQPGKNEFSRVHHTVRRVTGYRMKCVPEMKKFCSIFTYNGLSKKFCLKIKTKHCTALD